MNQTFHKYNSFREKLKNKEFIVDKENSDEENIESPSRKDSSIKNEAVEDSQNKTENANNNNNTNKGANLKALFTGEWEEMQKKKEQELAKQNKKKIIAVENLPTLGNFSFPNEEKNFDILNNNNEENINDDYSNKIIEEKESKLIIENENKEINLISNANAIIVPGKKGNKKANAKKKFVNLDFGAKLGFQKEEEVNQNIDDMPEEDILVKNLVNKKPKEIKKSTLISKGKK